MPSKSKAQHNLMEGVAHNAAFAKKVGIPQSVGRNFAEADKGKKFSKGGASTQPKRQSINQPKTNHGGQALFKQGGTMATKMGKPTMKFGMSTAKDGMKKGGMPMKMKDGKKVPIFAAKGGGIEAKGKTKGKQVSMSGNKGMKSGGMAKKYC